ncbi:hypothetical protein CUR178_05395 [Leishmania enriettii]|uniref:RING-type domain-containing protein n=1 Tax=Leishmania enriettii TaxID=5663 RepID=A0A836GPA9_LEIEN|nr:hypothetical protein CUR178_05395 [Leishmania enriettii]
MSRGHRISGRHLAHASDSSCVCGCDPTHETNGRRPAATAATGASPSSLAPSSDAEQPLTEAAYHLTSQEVQRRAQQALTAQVRGLLESRLQKRLQQARIAHTQKETARRPRPPPEPSHVSSLDSHTASAWPTRTPSDVAAVDTAPPASAEQEPPSEDIAPLVITAMLTHGGAIGENTVRQGSTAAASVAHSSLETSIIDVHPYSAVELVRVHRLRGVRKHNRGLFAGLSKRSFTTRSGHYTVGQEGERLRRARSGVSGFMSGDKCHSGAVSGSPPRLTLRSLRTNSRILFQWTEDKDSAYGIPEESEECGSLFNEGTAFCNAFEADHALLAQALKGMLEHRYGKRMTAEERAEAARRLSGRREGQRGTSASYSTLEGKYSCGDSHSSTGGRITRTSNKSSGVRENEQRRCTKSDKGSLSGFAASKAGRGMSLGHALSPAHCESDHNTLLALDTPTLGAHAKPHSPGDPLLTLAALGHCFSVSLEGGSRRQGAGGDALNTTFLAALSLSSLGHTMTADEAEAHRRKRCSHVGFVDLDTRRKLGGSEESTTPSEIRGRSRGAYGSLSAPGSASRQSIVSAPGSATLHHLSNTACLILEAKKALVDEQSSIAGGRPQGDAQDTTSGGADPGGRCGDAGDKGDFCHYKTSADAKEATFATGHGTSEGFATERAQQRTLASLSEASTSASEISGHDSCVCHVTTDDDSRHLDEFLIHFPEKEDHVRLRRTAKNVLEGVEEMWEEDSSREAFLLPKFLNPNFPFPGLDDVVGAADAVDDHSERGEGSTDDEHEPLTGFGVNEAELNEKFRIEAEEECSELVAQRDELLAEVEGQLQLLDDIGADVLYLSAGQARTGMTAEQYAIALTSEVNRYAKSHRLRLNRALAERCQQQEQDGETQATVESAADGFLDRFGKERAERADAGCQVCDADLCYIDDAVRTTEEQLEDLLLHEKALVNAVRLATVAVANIMTFHASLEMESTCHECFFVFDKPRTLWPCGHTFCLSCLSNMYNRRGELICSECGSICEVGYTPNISVELISNYQIVCKRDEAGADVEPDSVLAREREAQTIEGVLRSLLNDLLSTQSSWAALSSGHSPVKAKGGV